jgi:uncharacterized CHY-type Zn-finger protein
MSKKKQTIKEKKVTKHTRVKICPTCGFLLKKEDFDDSNECKYCKFDRSKQNV